MRKRAKLLQILHKNIHRACRLLDMLHTSALWRKTLPLMRPHRNLQKYLAGTLNCHCGFKGSRQNIHILCAICEDRTDWCKLLLRGSQDDQICLVIKVIHWQACSLECQIIRSFWHVMIFLIIISLQILLMRSPQEHRKEFKSLIAEGQLAARAPLQTGLDAAVTTLESMEIRAVMSCSLLGSGVLRSQEWCCHQRRIFCLDDGN